MTTRGVDHGCRGRGFSGHVRTPSDEPPGYGLRAISTGPVREGVALLCELQSGAVGYELVSSFDRRPPAVDGVPSHDLSTPSSVGGGVLSHL